MGLLVIVATLEGSVPVAGGKAAWGISVVRHTVVVLEANTTDVTTVKAFVGQPEAFGAHSVMTK